MTNKRFFIGVVKWMQFMWLLSGLPGRIALKKFSKLNAKAKTERLRLEATPVEVSLKTNEADAAKKKGCREAKFDLRSHYKNLP